MPIAMVGEPAPDFILPVFDPSAPENTKLEVSLTSYRGRWLVFFYYPMDFTFVCPTEILALADRRSEFEDAAADILGASTDTIYTHRAWAQTPRSDNGIEGVSYPLAADHSGRVARSYGILLEEEHAALRGLFIIDPAGVLQYSVIHALQIGRSVDETLRVLKALQMGGLCPSDWKPGQPTLTPGQGRRRAA